MPSQTTRLTKWQSAKKSNPSPALRLPLDRECLDLRRSSFCDMGESSLACRGSSDVSQHRPKPANSCPAAILTSCCVQNVGQFVTLCLRATDNNGLSGLSTRPDRQLSGKHFRKECVGFNQVFFPLVRNGSWSRPFGIYVGCSKSIP